MDSGFFYAYTEGYYQSKTQTKAISLSLFPQLCQIHFLLLSFFIRFNIDFF